MCKFVQLNSSGLICLHFKLRFHTNRSLGQPETKKYLINELFSLFWVIKFSVWSSVTPFLNHKFIAYYFLSKSIFRKLLNSILGFNYCVSITELVNLANALLLFQKVVFFSRVWILIPWFSVSTVDLTWIFWESLIRSINYRLAN